MAFVLDRQLLLRFGNNRLTSDPSQSYSDGVSVVSRRQFSLTLMIVFALGACGLRDDLPTLVPTQPSPTSPSSISNEQLTLVFADYPPPGTPAPTVPVIPYPPFPTPTFGPSPTPEPTWTPRPTFTPEPTLIPPLDPTQLTQLLASIYGKVAEGTTNHALQRVSGWSYGFRRSTYCADGPYRWLDDTTLQIYPITGEYQAMGIAEETVPIALNVYSNVKWFPPTNGPTSGCDLPLWSDTLNVVIATTANEVILLDVDGIVTKRFSGGLPLYFASSLAPSGKRLLTGLIWRDLETGREVNLGDRFTGKGIGFISDPSWSQDEARIFGCCFAYLDANAVNTTTLSLTTSTALESAGPAQGSPAI